jgi:hypothetical protein
MAKVTKTRNPPPRRELLNLGTVPIRIAIAEASVAGGAGAVDVGTDALMHALTDVATRAPMHELTGAVTGAVKEKTGTPIGAASVVRNEVQSAERNRALRAQPLKL